MTEWLHSVKQGRVDHESGLTIIHMLLGWDGSGLRGDLWGIGSLCGRSAAVVLVDAGGNLGSAGNSVTVDSVVELDDCGLGGHG